MAAQGVDDVGFPILGNATMWGTACRERQRRTPLLATDCCYDGNTIVSTEAKPERRRRRKKRRGDSHQPSADTQTRDSDDSGKATTT